MIATSPAPFEPLAPPPVPQTPASPTSGLRILSAPDAAPASVDRARELFRQAWSLMEKPQRTADDNELMINSAHASRYYWEEAGTVTNRAVAEWLLSRAYVTLGRVEPALYHANRCEKLAATDSVNTLCRAYAQEALGRAYLLGGHREPARNCIEAGESLAEKLSSGDAFYLKQELKSLRDLLG